MTRILQLYTTQGCHLCEYAEEMARPLLPPRVHLVLIEISESEQLMDRYGVRIPVLRFETGDRELGWPFSESELKEFLGEGAKAD